MTRAATLTVPDVIPLTALEAMAALEPDAQWVLVFEPSWLNRGRIPDAWSLSTVREWDAGLPPRDGWIVEAPQDAPEETLREFAQGLLRRPVTLRLDHHEIRLASRPHGRWHVVPLYWVTPDT